MALVTRRPWRVTVRRMNHPFPPLFEIIGSTGRREFVRVQSLTLGRLDF
jgi:hypothetical protein